MLISKAVSADRKGKIGLEVATLARIAELPEIKEAFDATAYYRYGKALEKLGRDDEALSYYERLKGEIDVAQSCSAMVRQTYLHLRRGDYDPAIRLIEFLTEAFAFDDRFGAFSDFADSIEATVSTDTPGVRFVSLNIPPPTTVPGPATLVLLGVGLASLGCVRRRSARRLH